MLPERGTLTNAWYRILIQLEFVVAVANTQANSSLDVSSSRQMARAQCHAYPAMLIRTAPLSSAPWLLKSLLSFRPHNHSRAPCPLLSSFPQAPAPMGFSSWAQGGALPLLTSCVGAPPSQFFLPKFIGFKYHLRGASVFGHCLMIVDHDSIRFYALSNHPAQRDVA